MPSLLPALTNQGDLKQLLPEHWKEPILTNKTL